MAVEQTSNIRVESPPSPVSKTEQAQIFVETLAAQVRQVSLRRQGRAVQRDLAVYADWLADAHSYFERASRKELNLTYASEWVLDNYYIIRQALREIGEDLPQGFYNELPKLIEGPNQGFPRIYVVTSAALSHINNMVNMEELETILISLQEHAPLTMGE